jgi:enolase-phosphatase E1
VLFPFARTHGPPFIRNHWDDEILRDSRNELIEQNKQHQSEGAQRISAGSDSEAINAAIDYFLWLMQRDSKVTPLKAMQGFIWDKGFENGELQSEIFADVPAALSRWRDQGRTVAIYSSGSTAAQHQVFQHSNLGDLTKFIDAYFDTRSGQKRAPSSYAAIALELNVHPSHILFCSDVLEELDAAVQTGLAGALCIRPGNAVVVRPHSYTTIRSFDDLP